MIGRWLHSGRTATTRPSFITCLSASLIALSGAPVSAQDWTGIWAGEATWCQFADRIGSHNPAPIEITATEVNGLENSCEIKTVQVLEPLRAWSLSLECQSEGDTYDDHALLMLADDNALWRWNGAGEPFRLVRCVE